jgi:hypothetical protein
MYLLIAGSPPSFAEDGDLSRGHSAPVVDSPSRAFMQFRLFNYSGSASESESPFLMGSQSKLPTCVATSRRMAAMMCW